VAEIELSWLNGGIAEEASRANAAAHLRLQAYNRRYGLRRMFSEQNRLLLNALGTGGNLLEVGCGIGNFLIDATREGAFLKVYAVEVSLHTARIALAVAPSVQMISLAPAETLPFRSDCFDAVVTRGVLHHLADPAVAVREMHRVLKTGGRLVILEGNPASKYRRLMLGIADCFGVPHEDTHYRHLWPQEIEELLSVFKQVHMTSINGLFAPLAYVGIGGVRVWNVLTGILKVIARYQPDSFDWWKLWVAQK